MGYNIIEQWLLVRNLKSRLMKNLLLLFVAFTLIGCSVHIHNGELVESSDNQPELELVYKNRLYYYIGKLYSGKNYVKYNNGRIKQVSHFKNGKKDGDWAWYTENGQFIRGETWDEYGLVKTTERL
jgi:hypothetical protein